MSYLPQIFAVIWQNLMTIKIPSTNVPVLGLLVGCMIFTIAIHFIGSLLDFYHGR